MLKSFFCILAIFFICTLSITSCNKENEPTPQTIDSLKSILPKQIILLSGEPDSVVISFKYDTLNHKLELYEDDPSTPNLYDKLALTCTFNNDGYLTGYNMNTDIFGYSDFNNEVININRTSDNKINYIVFNDLDYNEKDTSYYTYKPINDGTKISVIGYQSYFENSLTDYTYDSNNKLLSYAFPETTPLMNVLFSYNSNNSIAKIIKTGSDFDNVAVFSYTSGLPDDKEDMLGRILLGKDDYLWDLKELNPFSFYLDADYDDYPISFTDPYHITRIQDTHKPDAAPTGIEGLNIAYELNQNKLLYKVSVKYDDENKPGIILFKY